MRRMVRWPPAWRRIALAACLGALLLMGLGGACAAQAESDADSSGAWQLPPLYLFSWMLPLGLTLIAVSARTPDRTHELATALPLALVVAMGGYWLCGFGLQLGGIGLVIKGADLDHLVAEWSPFDLRMGAGWGLVGLRAIPFAPSKAGTAERALFLSQLPWVATAALIPLVSLHGRAPRLAVLAAAALAACVCYPLAGNWILSGGWLSQLGITLDLGQGFVDSPAGFPLLTGSLVALAGLLAFRRRMLAPPHSAPELPQAHLPLYVLLGAFLAFLGWLGALVSQPLGAPARDTTLVLLNALGSVAGASATTLLYGWLARGRADATLSARGIVAALAAISAPVGWVSFGAAVLLGAIAGLLLAPVTYLVERLLGWEDAGAAGMLALPTALGLLAVGVLPDARTGAAVAATQGQLQAQLVGLGALFLVAGILPWMVLGLLAQAYERPERIAPQQRRRGAPRGRRGAEQSPLLEPGPIALWRWIKARVHPEARAGRRLRHRARIADASARTQSPLPTHPSGAQDSAGNP